MYYIMTWNIYGKSYDLTEFINEHPGGSFILESTKNHPDITSLFESYHAFHKDIDSIKKRLDKYEIKDSDTSIQKYDYTSYRELTQLVKEKFPNRDSIKSNTLRIVSNILLIIGYIYLTRFIILTELNLYLKLPVAYVLGTVDCAFFLFNTVHDSSHYAISTSPLINNIVYKVTSSLFLWNNDYWTNHHVISHHSDTGRLDDPDSYLYDFKLGWLTFPYMTFLPGQYLGQILFYIVGYRFKTINERNYDYIDISLMSLKIFFLYKLGLWSAITFLVAVNTCYFVNVFPNHSLYETKITNKYEGNDWLRLQVQNSGNFLNNNKLWTIMFGGINYQIEHHLYPSISNIHLPEVSVIVRKYCKEHNIPYVHKETLYDTFYSFWKYTMHNNKKEN